MTAKDMALVERRPGELSLNKYKQKKKGVLLSFLGGSNHCPTLKQESMDVLGKATSR